MPAIVAGDYGKGKVLCASAGILSHAYAGINPQDGPNALGIARLWQAVAHWIRTGSSLPIDQAIRHQQEKLSMLKANLLPNGDFSKEIIMGHPAYWMAAVLGALHTAGSFQVLARFTEHENRYVANWACQSISRHANPEALPEMSARAAEWGQRCSLEGLREALRALLARWWKVPMDRMPQPAGVRSEEVRP
jgi:hypothetical protein